jgi:hypothetical protein
MRGRVDDGDIVTISPYGTADPHAYQDDVVRVRGRAYLHLIKARPGDRFQIESNRGRINGWVGRGTIFGRAIRIESPVDYERWRRGQERQIASDHKDTLARFDWFLERMVEIDDQFTEDEVAADARAARRERHG